MFLKCKCIKKFIKNMNFSKRENNNQHYLFIRYSHKNLEYSISNKFSIGSNGLKYNYHLEFLKEYLGEFNLEKAKYGLHAKSILIERNYKSQSYLDDYHSHYVSTHYDYPKDCKRVHFFSKECKEYTDKVFEKILFEDDEEFWNSYLGYIIIRPIPNGSIGATLLKTYNNENTRKYTTLRKYKVNVFGKKLELDTLIYIQHDSIVGACATSALFMSFHKVSKIFQRQLPNPTKITISAGMSDKTPGRILPNRDGLDIWQICKSIDSIGLVSDVDSPYLIHDDVRFNNHWIKSVLYAYVRIGIPAIMGFFLEGKSEKLHAVTVTGYKEVDLRNESVQNIIKINSKLQKYQISESDISNLKADNNLFRDYITLKSYFIEKFYVHDDQIGPFARISFSSNDSEIETAWWNGTNIENKKIATYYATIVPIIEYIKIPFKLVILKIFSINKWISLRFQLEHIVWDIYLDYSNEYKNRLLKNGEDIHQKILLSSLPKYIWIAECSMLDKKLFDIVLDPTEINEDNFIIDIIYHSTHLKETFRDILLTKVKRYDNDIKLINLQTFNSILGSMQIELIKPQLEYEH